MVFVLGALNRKPNAPDPRIRRGKSLPSPRSPIETYGLTRVICVKTHRLYRVREMGFFKCLSLVANIDWIEKVEKTQTSESHHTHTHGFDTELLTYVIFERL